MARPASKVWPDVPKWDHLEPFLRTLAALLATWSPPLRVFMYFCQVFVNNCEFLLKIHEKTTEVQQIARKITNIAQKLRKGA